MAKKDYLMESGGIMLNASRSVQRPQHGMIARSQDMENESTKKTDPKKKSKGIFDLCPALPGLSIGLLPPFGP
jgi:hypothetical protein